MTTPFDSLRAALGDRYALERELGRGGMATVYLARDLRHGRPVAIKVLRPEIAAALGPERFLREIEVAARLTHPHILPLHDSGEAAGLLFYVMPYIEGESLRDRLEREGQLPFEEAVRITRDVAGALSYDVVHRDIKPENILLSGGEAVVADFGIARAITAAAWAERAGGDRQAVHGSGALGAAAAGDDSPGGGRGDHTSAREEPGGPVPHSGGVCARARRAGRRAPKPGGLLRGDRCRAGRACRAGLRPVGETAPPA